MAHNKLTFDFTSLSKTLNELTAIGADTRGITERVVLEAAEKIQDDVKAALAPQYMPAGGRYSTGETANSVINPHVNWVGSRCEAPIGFDKSKSGAGGFLITGTPKMRPNTKLYEIFEGRRYMQKVMKSISDEMLHELAEEIAKK